MEKRVRIQKAILTLALLFMTSVAFGANWNIEDGMELYKAQRYEDAIRFFEGYVGNYPNDPDGHYYLGVIYKELQDFNKSSYHLKKAYELANMPSDVVVAPSLNIMPDEDYTDMALMYYEDGELDKALAYADLAEKVNPENSFVNYLKAQIYYRKKNIDVAKKYMNRALQEDEWYLSSELARTLGIKTVPPFDAQYYSEKGLQYYYGANALQAKSYFEKAVVLEPKNARLYNNLAMANMRLGENESAKANFKKAIALNSGYSTPYLNLAKLEPKSAESYLKRALRANPNDAQVYYALGNYYFEKKDLKNAIKNYEMSTSIDTKYFEPYFALAVCYSELDDYKNAMVFIRRASELNNKSAELSYYLAKLCLLNKRPDEAQKYLAEAIRKGEAPIYYIELGKIYYSRQDWSAAGNAFQKALELDMKLENEAELYNYLGLCEYKTLSLDRAIYNLKKAVQLEPKSIIYSYNLAQAYKSNSQKDLYEKTVESILAISPKTEKDYIDIAAIYFDRNNSYMALKVLDEGIARFPKAQIIYQTKLRFLETLGDNKAASELRRYIKEKF